MQVTNLTFCSKMCNIFAGFSNIFNEIRLMSLFWSFVYCRIPIVMMCLPYLMCQFFSEKLPFLKLPVS